ncbi:MULTISPECIES: hypothetical protein [Cyanophyceae]|uniref:hypothetical protein n=1 Tax=Cyanophyceae TaxID=3028117 RepID=UPI0002E389D4|nr:MULTISPECIES: hypothetical protein [Cyanophyceae]SMH52123.1 hypothetical protein SAMN06272755_2452 [Picosynechococcus sp. OG1]SMQ82267.1 hypothetical protein SAMN06272774_1726 [Synechococcus sp. 7002]
MIAGFGRPQGANVKLETLFDPVCRPVNRSNSSGVLYLFITCLVCFLLLWILRGFGVPPFTLLPGGIINIMLLLTLLSGILYGLEWTKNY